MHLSAEEACSMRYLKVRWYLGCAIILMTASGCFQQAGSDLQSTPIPQALPTETFTPPPPTNTEPPLPTETPVPTTVEAVPFTQEEAPAGDLWPTFTPPPEVINVEPQIVAQAEDPSLAQTATTQYLLDTQPLYASATAFILGATQTIDAQLTGTAVVIFPPTSTPLPTVDQTLQTQPLVPGADCIHEVRAEDQNLYRISLRYGTTVREIAAASGITNINLISIGQKLTIPGCGTLGVTPPPTSTPKASATPFGAVSTPVTFATTAPVVTAGGLVHVVEQGETLFEISLRYGVPVNDIAAANGIANINTIYLGQELVIP
jgi:LysM repeat protein